MNKIKNFARKYLFSVIATTYFQRLFKFLYRLSLWGMNIGLGGNVEDSGESEIFKQFLKSSISLKSNKIIFDVGANQGQFAKMILNILGKEAKDKAQIYCFEPSSPTFKVLSNNLDNFGNIFLNNFGLGLIDEDLTLFFDKEGSRKASLYQRNSPELEMELTLTEIVNLKNLDNFCSNNNIQYIDYLKLDIEGHELNALLGGRNMLSEGRIGWIQFEFGGCNIDSRTYLRDFFELLSPNYNIYRLVRNGLVNINKYHETLEIFTNTNFIAKLKSLS